MPPAGSGGPNPAGAAAMSGPNADGEITWKKYAEAPGSPAAATEIARSAAPGSLEMKNPSPSLPPAATTMTPADAALLLATTSGSLGQP